PDGDLQGDAGAVAETLQVGSWDLQVLQQGRQVELLHLQEGPGEPGHAYALLAAQHLIHFCRHDLPGHAIAILAPAALLGLRYRRQLRPVTVDLGLVLAVDNEGDRLVEARPMSLDA